MEIIVQNECSKQKIKSIFLPILESVTHEYTKRIPETVLLNIRLLGSVARGDAREKHSDIDFVAIGSRRLTKDEIESVAESAGRLTDQFPCVRKVDMEYEIKGSISPSRDFIFATDSLSVCGNDLYPEATTRIDSRVLAQNNTPDIDLLIKAYREGVSNSRAESELFQYSRWIGKDILKSMRGRLIIDYGIYEKEVGKIATQLENHYPEEKILISMLKDLYFTPEKDPEKMSIILDKVDLIKRKYQIE